MKVGDVIKVVKDCPVSGQCGIQSLVGKTFPVAEICRTVDGKPTGEIGIDAPHPFEGRIILNHNEYAPQPKVQP